MNHTEHPDHQCEAPGTDLLGRDTLRQVYADMAKIRRFEERAAREYAAGRISGFCHLYIGQEAVATGSIATLQPKDHVITAYRDHGHALLRGCTARQVMAELFGKVTGCASGRGGSMHMFAKEAGFHGGHGIVGAHIPLAAGLAFASKYEDRKEVTLCYFGDGALNQGAFYESLNLASLWDLPCVFIVENNRYAMGTSLERASAMGELYKKAEGFGMTGVVVDGMDVAAMYRVTQEAVERARETNRPTFIEARCYRYRGHSMSDPAKYRTKEEVNDFKQIDPILLARQTLLAKGWATEEEMTAWDKDAKEAAKDAADFAHESPQPSLNDVGKYVYAEPLQWTPEGYTTPHNRDH